MLEQGAIALIPVPFTDLSSTKRRPVIVIASNEYITTTPDMIVVAMTSNPTQTPYSFTITNDDLVAGSLNRPGQVRTDKIYTIAQHIAVRVFGKVKTEIIQRIVTLLHKATAVEL
ncbi:MAG: type II toxin-antitoxin system PemK/MazF family toxin [Chloroflexales bacterium]|nr:type II toxin-antitoxin system PemK/MazF family toxin [Chloroflexales bacterium]